MSYQAPIDDILFSLRLAAGDAAFAESGVYSDIANGVAEQTLREAEKFASAELLPLDKSGDRIGARFMNGGVSTAPGWREAYEKWIDSGWNALSADPHHGGMGLPLILNAACTEVWNGANMAFSLCPLLSHGAIEALEAHACPEIKNTYLPAIISGKWPATMNLTEPQAGTDLALLRTRAERASDDAYHIFGQKIYITYGEHDLSSNIVHLVLARLPDAPAGTRGISLFLVPKFLPDENGAFTRRNDVQCVGIEHKLGIHGSPTCTMSFGEKGGAIGFLIGTEHNGLACMFTMMNNARLSVGIQGVALSERATQIATAYARERKQGKSLGSQATSAIIAHPDVARMLLIMASLTAAARSICFETAASLDFGHRDKDKSRATASQARASLLTPIAKAFSTDIANEVTSLGIQVFGGMGYIEETGAAQLMRDARICAIYEGTNGVQAADLVTRKLGLCEGLTLKNEIADMQAAIEDGGGDNLAKALEALTTTSAFMVKALNENPNVALAGATPYLRLFALVRAGATLRKSANLSRALKDPHAARRALIAQFFSDHIATAAPGLAKNIMTGANTIINAQEIFNVR